MGRAGALNLEKILCYLKTRIFKFHFKIRLINFIFHFINAHINVISYFSHAINSKIEKKI